MNYGIRPTMQYLDWANAVKDSPLNVIAADQAKFNVTWLLYPEIDLHGLEVVPMPYVEHLHKHMDKQTRAHLMTMPLNFTRYWSQVGATSELAEKFPSDYWARMTIQAHKAQARMLVRDGNVIAPEFWRAT